MIPWQYTWLLFDDRWTAGMKTLISYVTVFTSSYRHWKASTSYWRSCQQTLYLWMCWRSLCCELCCQWENFFCTWTLVSLYTGCFLSFLKCFLGTCVPVLYYLVVKAASIDRYLCLAGSLLLLFLNVCAKLCVLRRINTVASSRIYRVGQKTGLFSDLITLWRLVLERRAACQNFRNFIEKKGTKLAFQWV